MRTVHADPSGTHAFPSGKLPAVFVRGISMRMSKAMHLLATWRLLCHSSRMGSKQNRQSCFSHVLNAVLGGLFEKACLLSSCVPGWVVESFAEARGAEVRPQPWRRRFVSVLLVSTSLPCQRYPVDRSIRERFPFRALALLCLHVFSVPPDWNWVARGMTVKLADPS